jgi:DNA-binding transcriptional LysR family regulator
MRFGSWTKGVVDAAIGVRPGSEARILSLPLFEEEFVSIARESSAAASALTDLTHFAAASHVLVSPEGDEYGVVDEPLAKAGVSRRLGLVLLHMYAAPSVVAQTDLIATPMRGVVEASGLATSLVTQVPPMELPTVQFHLLWHRRTDGHPAHQWLRARVLGVASELMGRQPQSG